MYLLITYNQKIKYTGMLKIRSGREGMEGGGEGLVLTSVSHPRLNKIPPFKSMKSHHASASLLKFKSHVIFVFFAVSKSVSQYMNPIFYRKLEANPSSHVLSSHV